MNTYRLIAASCLLSSALLIGSGCASVVRGSSEKLVIQSVPSRAEVKLSTGHSGLTPFEVEVKRRDSIMVTVSKPGYKELTTAVVSSIDGASLGIGTAANLLFLPVINDIVDYKTGANYSHKPNPLIVTLIPIDSEDEYKLTAPPVPVATTEDKPVASNPVSSPLLDRSRVIP